MADTLLYGTISLLTACAATAIVPAFYRVNEPYGEQTWKFYTAGIENFCSPLPVSQEEGRVMSDPFQTLCTSAVRSDHVVKESISKNTSFRRDSKRSLATSADNEFGIRRGC